MKSIANRLKPDYYESSLADIDIVALKNKGIKHVLVDIDNTLCPHGADLADDYARKQIARIKSIGLECTIISNAGRKRAEKFANSLQLEFVAKAGKPSPKGIFTATNNFTKSEKNNTAIIGDQIFTDILAGNSAGIMTILVKPISRFEALQVAIKRPLECIVRLLLDIKINPVI